MVLRSCIDILMKNGCHVNVRSKNEQESECLIVANELDMQDQAWLERKRRAVTGSVRIMPSLAQFDHSFRISPSHFVGESTCRELPR